LSVFQGKWQGFEKDKHRVYFTEYPIIDADPATFSVLGTIWIGNDYEAGVYARDNETVYFSDQGASAPTLVSGANASTFRLVQPDLKATGTNETFSEVSCGKNCVFDADDGVHKYYLGQIVQ
jgi:hypothetical protein